MKQLQTQTEWKTDMSEKVLSLIHSELYLDLRFLELAFSALNPKPHLTLQSFATDGFFLYYSPERLLQVFQSNPKFLNRAMLHSVLHCVFSHLWLCQTDNKFLWNLSCDIAVEYTIDQLGKKSTKRILTLLRQQCYEKLQGMKTGLSAATIYRFLDGRADEELQRLQAEFYTDDHRFWPSEQKNNATLPPQAQQWNQISRQISLQQLQAGSQNEAWQRNFESQAKIQRSRRSYRDFLQKFTIFREELQLDLDEFDLSYYTYGIHLYKNLPLIEPLETKELRKIEEFVIVIDTSESTNGALVTAFLRETFAILSQRQNFFQKCQLRILQCDTDVRSDLCIHDLDTCEKILKDFHILGGGGTDFRPAFNYVNHLISTHVIHKLGGLLYFTDGKGIYPTKKPAYPTAFLFLQDYAAELVPPWAMRLQLNPDEFTKTNEIPSTSNG